MVSFAELGVPQREEVGMVSEIGMAKILVSMLEESRRWSEGLLVIMGFGGVNSLI